MAIAFSQAVGMTTTTASGTNHTLVASASISALTNGVAFVWIEEYANSTPSSASWGGVAMTQITTARYNAVLARNYSLWYLLNPGTGTVAITATTSVTTTLSCMYMTLSGVSQSAPTISDSSTTSSTTVARTTMTTVDDNSWIAGFYVASNNSSPAPTPDANTTIRNNYFNYWGAFTAGPITPAASTTAGVSAMTSGESTVNAIVFSPFSPSVTTGAAFLFLMM